MSPLRGLDVAVLRSVLPRSRRVIFYGSGAVRHAGGADADPTRLVDMLIVRRNFAGATLPGLTPHMTQVCRSRSRWHASNRRRHPHHYPSTWALMPPSADALVDFVPNVRLAGVPVKYGVVEEGVAGRDLLTWRHLYVAGRLQKPHVDMVLSDADAVLDRRWEWHKRRNLEAALATALLLLPQRFTARRLYETVASLSYRGDVRSGLAEDPGKVANIVNGDPHAFPRLYGPLLGLEGEGDKGEGGVALPVASLVQRVGRACPDEPLDELFEQCLDGRPLGEFPSSAQQKRLVSELPLEVRRRVSAAMVEKAGSPVADDVDRALRDINGATSSAQMWHGLQTAGPASSLRYVWRKLGKRWGL